ncbi:MULTISPECIES: hypothetical protein [Vibrio]|uniref:hypothetical protein n=1 Tax=Vibrio TaxID=662 RepID=UPI001B811B68|nr:MULTISPECIES: hypothetical protein [Vibrio]BDP38262.1 hypothetical protein VA208B3_46330 [Vibrio alginolyticus]MDF5646488.1 hypothetical protein [Vibrio parahaemolyticus]MDF5666254.1 hypothetical protein [Vibrio parahaemolyticus]WKV19509.1 hypothetical protein [Vibrio parahaemolyticus]BDP33497.1 hypothetical protein VV208B2_45770 [Vibrio vulnificus]
MAGTKHAFLKAIEKTYPLTFVDDERDLHTEELALTKAQLVEILTHHQKATDKSVPAYIPGTFNSPKTKAVEEVRQLSLLVYDVDCKTTTYTLSQLESKLEGYAHIIHSTYSATYEAPRWRVILFPSNPIQPEEFHKVYVGTAKRFNIEIDQTCTNANRLFYLPSVNVLNDFVFSTFNDGKEIAIKEPKIKTKKKVNRGYVSLSSVSEGSKDRLPCQFGKASSNGFANGFVVPPALKAPFTKEQFDELLSHPGTWLRAAEYMGLPVEGIGSKSNYSKSFSSVIPGVEDRKPSCSLGLLSDTTRLVYFAFNEVHETTLSSGPVKFDLAHIFAMMKCGRRIPQTEFKSGMHKAWLTRLLIDSGMIIPQPVTDLPELPTDAKSAERLYVGFKELLQCKRAFIDQIDDPTAFSLTFACYWCGIGNRNTAKKYTQMLLEHGVLRFVDKITLPRGGSIPVLLPAGKTTNVYQMRKRNSHKKSVEAEVAKRVPTANTVRSTNTERLPSEQNSCEVVTYANRREIGNYARIDKLHDDYIFADQSDVNWIETDPALNKIHETPRNLGYG